MSLGITQDQADQLLAQARMETEQANMQELLSKMSNKCFLKCSKPSRGDKLDSNEQSCTALCMDRYVDVIGLVNKAVIDRQAMRG